MEAPESVVLDLKGIRDTLFLRWNPRAKLARAGYIDATGAVTQPEWEGRWELWDKPDAQPERRVMTLQTPEGAFRAPGQWLVDLVGLFNPARYDGDVNRMLYELMDRPEQLREEIEEKDADDFFEMVARWAGWVQTTKSRVLTDHCAPLTGV